MEINLHYPSGTMFSLECLQVAEGGKREGSPKLAVRKVLSRKLLTLKMEGES